MDKNNGYLHSSCVGEKQRSDTERGFNEGEKEMKKKCKNKMEEVR